MEQHLESAANNALPSDEMIDGRYKLLEEIGRGSMAVIYRALDQLMQRDVALKIMICDHDVTELYREQFDREIKALSLLEHENLVRIFSAGFDTKRGPYLTMELLPGMTLEQIFGELKAINKEDFLKIFLPVLSGLAYAQSKNIVHRDLKPGNIFICYNSQGSSDGGARSLLETLGDPSSVKIVDFGISKIFFPEAIQSATHTVGLPPSGTAAYMSPEQSAGKPTDFRSDIYSLACIMYQAITGQAPFKGETAMETMYEHLRSSVPKITEVTGARNYTKELVDVVMEALSKEPENRPQTAEQFKSKIQNASFSKNILKKRKEMASPILIGLSLLVVIPLLSLFVLKNVGAGKNIQPPLAQQNNTQASKLMDKSGLALLAKAQQLDFEGNSELAETCYVAGLKKLPDTMADDKRMGYLRLGGIFVSNKRYDDALRAFQDSLRYSPPDAYDFHCSIYLVESNCYRSLGKEDKATKLFNECLKLAQSDKIERLTKADVYKTHAYFEQKKKHDADWTLV